jgi:hypothetical protein
VASLGEGLGALTAWQRELLGLMIEQPDRTFRLALHTGRANGRSAVDRVMLAAELHRTGHVHKLTAFGGWCVTMTGIGPLWIELPRPRRGGPPRPAGWVPLGTAEPEPGPVAGYLDELTWRRAVAAGPAEPAGRDVVAEINAVLAGWADWENGDTAARWQP